MKKEKHLYRKSSFCPEACFICEGKVQKVHLTVEQSYEQDH